MNDCLYNKEEIILDTVVNTYYDSIEGNNPNILEKIKNILYKAFNEENYDIECRYEHTPNTLYSICIKLLDKDTNKVKEYYY